MEKWATTTDNDNQQPTPDKQEPSTTINNKDTCQSTASTRQKHPTTNNIQLSPTHTPDNKTKQTRQQARVKTKIFAEQHLTLYVFAKSKIIAVFLSLAQSWRRPEPWPRVAPFIQSHSSLHIATRITDRKKKAWSCSLVFTRDTPNRDREKSWDQAHLFNIWTIGSMIRTSGQPQVSLSLLRSI